jgi:uncharacterized protein (UPF0332 family)
MDDVLRNQIRRYIEMAEEDLQAAGFLIGQGFYRAAINRSYYACFQMINGALLSQDIDPERTRKKEILSAFKTIFTFDSQMIEPEYCRAYEQIEQLKQAGDRVNGDPPTREEADWAHREAQRFVERLK